MQSDSRVRFLAAARRALAFAALIALSGCREPPPQALGTLEYDRVTLPAPAFERIVEIPVREGERVRAGQVILKLEAERSESQLAALQADVRRQQAALVELQVGPRSEAIAQARAQLNAAQAQARDAAAYLTRVEPLGRRQLVAAADVDRARAASAQAAAQVRAAQAALLELEHGTRSERLLQGEAWVQAAQAQARAQQLTLAKLAITAPRAGIVDSLPYRLGDQAPGGAALAVLLVGDAPYARVHVPEPIRRSVAVGQVARVFVGGRAEVLRGKVRMIRSEPSFTPYYALIGDDAARLSYLAEIELFDAQAKNLPAGLPVRVEFDTASP